jgi:hypothetical protein
MLRKNIIENNLNSVLIEGALEDDPVFSGEGAASFAVLSYRVVEDKISGKLEWETTRVGIIADDTELVKICMGKGKKGRGVRVVGRLVEAGTGCLCVNAEHAEFRPEFKKTNSTKKKQQAKINKE